MLVHPDFDPIAISLGPLKVRWYGLMYLVGFLLAWWLGKKRASRPGSGWQSEEVSDLIFYGVLGVMLGGRIGYVLFYNPMFYLSHPLDMLRVWEGGMSFHGGLIGVLAAVWLYARRYRKTFLQVTDFIAPLTPLGLGAGRIGNFINQELPGRITDVPWGMVFRDAGDLPRHPSQLYEATLEGVVLFAILWWYSAKPRPLGAVSGAFLVFYALFRFLIELVREPDPQLGYLAFGWFTMGQLLSIPMWLIGIWMLWTARRKPHPA